MPMGWVAAATALSGVLGSQASKGAAGTQSDSARAATEAQRDIFNQTKYDLSPWLDTGKLALGDLSKLSGVNGDGTFDPNAPLVKPFGMEDFKASPAFNFNLEQGKLALDKASAARGKFYAPSTLQDIAKFSQGLASNEFQNSFSNYNTNLKSIWDRLYSLSSSGQNAAAQQGGFGTTVGGQIGNNIIGAGNAQAAGQVGSANAFTGSLNNLSNLYLSNQALSNSQRGSTEQTQYIEMPQ